MNIDQIIDGIIAREGGYSDHPADKGGPTAWGITEAVARANGFDGDMRAFPQSFARDIYKRRYWLDPKFGAVSLISEAVAEELADTGVNMGPGMAVRFLQRALNALNQGGTLYPDLKPDGIMGPTTLNALNAYKKHRGHEGERVLLNALNCLQGARYVEITEDDPTQETWLYGWLRARVVFVP